jgi:hypothetical protein
LFPQLSGLLEYYYIPVPIIILIGLVTMCG